MKKKVFICTNNKQMLGALLSRFSIEKNLKNKESVDVEIIHVDELDIFKKFNGETFKRGERILTYTFNDLQSFTLTRFMPPELMNYEGYAVVIDPDVFSLSDINELFDIDMKRCAIVACSKRNVWDSSVMLLECSKLRHWNIHNILLGLKDKTLNYENIMQLRSESSILELPRVWNSLDKITSETKMLHTTERLTQPWKSGLPIDFTRVKMQKFFGFIPREPIHKLLGKYKTHYEKHPNKEVRCFFLSLLKDALEKGAVKENFLKEEVEKQHVRGDIFECLAKIT